MDNNNDEVKDYLIKKVIADMTRRRGIRTKGSETVTRSMFEVYYTGGGSNEKIGVFVTQSEVQNAIVIHREGKGGL